MGIRNLHTFLRSMDSEMYKTQSIADFKDKTFAVDTSIYMCKYKTSMGNRWLQGFWLMITLFKKNNIDLIFVFDAKPPPEKEIERHLRTLQKEKMKKRVDLITTEFYNYQKRNHNFVNVETFLKTIEKDFPNLHQYVKKHENTILDQMNLFFLIQKLENSIIRINPNDFQLLRELLDTLMVGHINAHSEAEGTCAYLNEMAWVDGVLTEDTDTLVYGCKLMLHSLKLKEEMVTTIRLDDILKVTSFKKPQFVDFCIMLGTDYNDNIPKLGPKTCYQLLMKHGSIENVEKLQKFNTAILNYERVRNLFQFIDYQFDPILQPNIGADKWQIQAFLFKNNLIFQPDNIALFL